MGGSGSGRKRHLDLDALRQEIEKMKLHGILIWSTSTNIGSVHSLINKEYASAEEDYKVFLAHGKIFIVKTFEKAGNDNSR